MSYRTDLDEILEVFNLSDNCRRVFVAAYESGEQTAGKLVDKLKLDRSSTYLAIDQLKAVGLVEVNESKRPKTIKAIAPRQLLGRVENRIQSFESVFDNLHENLKLFENAYNAKGNRPWLQLYSGKDGMQQIAEDILNSKNGEILLFTNQRAEQKVFSRSYHNHFIRKRRERNLPIRVLATNDTEGRRLKAGDKNNLRQTKLLFGPAAFECEVYIYQDKVAMLSYRDEIIGFIVNSPDFANLLKWQFEMIWRQT
jgi:sugar-specific transcriptional regulator TrmB